MKGTTEIHLTPAAMNDAIEYYLNNVVLMEDATVTDVVYNSSGGLTNQGCFRVRYREVEEVVDEL